IALRLARAEEEIKQRASGEPRQTVTVETRSYSKRAGDIEDMVQVTLNRQRLKVRWGKTGEPMRLQTLQYNTVDEARTAYFARIAELDARGYLDATTG
ncbi:MAG: SWIM zinc finger family protein, partial [Planctomycetia bacterium]|nr:SWIM zinc finger family protein [Planctomycetia bacterium]